MFSGRRESEVVGLRKTSDISDAEHPGGSENTDDEGGSSNAERTASPAENLHGGGGPNRKASVDPRPEATDEPHYYKNMPWLKVQSCYSVLRWRAYRNNVTEINCRQPLYAVNPP